MKRYRYLFGPVPSRRLGRSLGVDLTPYKTCSQDCVFCQLGRTTNKTLIREEYVPTDEVFAELDDWLKTDGKADHITLSGSGGTYTITIEDFAGEKEIRVMGRIPFDPVFTKAIVQGKTIFEYDGSSEGAGAVREIWRRLAKSLEI